LLSYRGSSLAVEIGWREGKLRAGDRAPDAICESSSGRIRLFDLFSRAALHTAGVRRAGRRAIRDLEWTPADILRKCSVRLSGSAEEYRTIIDTNGSAHAAYGISDQDNVIILVRPDGYVGLIASQNWMGRVTNTKKLLQ